MSLKTEAFYKTLSLSFILFCLFFSTNIHAEPKQRIIIYFKYPLSTDNTNSVHSYLKASGLTDYKIEEHSTDLRWIISLNTHIETAEMIRIKNELLKNQHIRLIENDQLLQRKSIM